MKQADVNVLAAYLARYWRPPPAISRADWCTQNLVLPPSFSATPGLYDLDRYSYWRGVLDASEDPEVEKIVIMAATQLGKTTMLLAVLLALAALAPVPAMLGAPDKDALKELREKVYEFCEASECLRDEIPPPRLRNDRWLDIGRMRAFLAYARNTQSMSGKSCALVVKTEIDRWKKTKTHGDPSSIIDQRIKAFHRALIIEESTPSDEASRIWAAYQASDRRQYYVPCPRCNHFQALRFFPLKKGGAKGRGGVAGIRHAKTGHWLSPEAALEAAYYLCEKGCRITSEKKPAMVQAGVWVPVGQSIDKRGKLAGKPKRSKRIWGGRLNSLYADPVSFGRMAAEYLAAREDLAKLQVWQNDWNGDRWLKKAKTPKWRELWQRLKGSLAPGVVPNWAVFLTAGVDVGETYCRWVVRAWGEGSTSALVDWGTTHKTVLDGGAGVQKLSHLEALREAVIDRYFPLAAANAAGRTKLRVRLTAIDCGYKPHDVHDFVRSLGEAAPRVRQIVGRDDIRGGVKWRSYVVERSARSGKVYAGGQTRWEVNRSIFNQDLHDRWKQPLTEPGAWWLTKAEISQAEQYLRELTSEAPVKSFTRDGHEKTVWQRPDTNVPNHYWDAEAYALAAADMLTAGDWTNLVKRVRKTPEGGAAAAAAAKKPAKKTGINLLERPGGWV